MIDSQPDYRQMLHDGRAWQDLARHQPEQPRPRVSWLAVLVDMLAGPYAAALVTRPTTPPADDTPAKPADARTWTERLDEWVARAERIAREI